MRAAGLNTFYSAQCTQGTKFSYFDIVINFVTIQLLKILRKPWNAPSNRDQQLFLGTMQKVDCYQVEQTPVSD